LPGVELGSLVNATRVVGGDHALQPELGVLDLPLERDQSLGQGVLDQQLQVVPRDGDARVLPLVVDEVCR
jgi:hypothetical protein